MAEMKKYLTLAASMVFAAGVAACDDAPTASTALDLASAPDLAAAGGGPNAATTDVFQFCKLADTGAIPGPSGFIFFPVPCLVDDANRAADVGDATLRRQGDGFTWQLKASGLEPGHSYTIWVGNFDGIIPPENPEIDSGDDAPAHGTEDAFNSYFEKAAFSPAAFDFGFGAGGLVGGNGKLVASGNHCVHPLGLDGSVVTQTGFEPGTPPDCDFVRLDEPIWLFLIAHGDWTPGDQIERRTPFCFDETGSPELCAGELYAFFEAPVE